MPHRVSPTERVRGHIDELFASGKQLPEILEEVARLGAQLLMQAALEAEITEFLGRGRYQRAAACEAARPGSRNGYREVTVKTTAGPVQLSRPKLRGTTGAFASRLFGSHVTKTNALESLVIASFVRGLSFLHVGADLERLFADYLAHLACRAASLGLVVTPDSPLLVNLDRPPLLAAVREGTVRDKVAALKKKGIGPAGWTPHWFRHTHASALLLAGTPEWIVSRRLGHAHVQTTIDLYGWVRKDEALRAAANWKIVRGRLAGR